MNANTIIEAAYAAGYEAETPTVEDATFYLINSVRS